MRAKRLIALLLMIIMAVTPVLVVSAFEGEQAQIGSDGAFVPRLKAPSNSNKYYYSDLNILHRVGYGMPNCTAYALGRAYEILGYEPDLCLNDADNWWQYNIDNHSYNYGQEPKLGAIACWNYTTGGGHVAVVEQIEDGVITYSNSAYGGQTFYLTYADVGAANGGIYNSTWVFKGYIYITEGISKEDYYATLGGDVYTVDSDNGINMRKGAGTSYDTLTAIPNGTQIVVTDTMDADGYTWGKTSYDGYNGWCVLKYTELVYKQPEPTEAPTEPATTEPTTTETPATQPETAVPTETVAATQDEVETTVPESDSDSIVGDVNGDGKVSVTDATLLQKFLAKVAEIDEQALALADADGNGKVNVSDATAIQKRLAGII